MARRRLAALGMTLLLAEAPLRASELKQPLPVQAYGLTFTHWVIVVVAVVAVLIWALCRLVTSRLSLDAPGRGQVLLETVVSAFDDLVRQSLGPNRGRKYLPYIGTLFLFIWSCNMIGLIPFPGLQVGGERWQDFNHNHVYDPGEPFTDADGDGIHDHGVPVPAFEEPTMNLNVPLGMAILFVLLIGHGSEIRYHGVGGYIKSYFSPPGVIGIVMFPLNVVGKVAELVSISFRLFGNIFGGVVIISVVSSLLYSMVVPVGLYGFFGIFVGTVQAFVFTMLALTYISMGASEEEEG
jgi:F-type H+-transporting ATPase subunit a